MTVLLIKKSQEYHAQEKAFSSHSSLQYWKKACYLGWIRPCSLGHPMIERFHLKDS